MEIKKPLKINYDMESIDQIVEKIEFAIEQHQSFLKVIPKEDLIDRELLNKKRDW